MDSLARPGECADERCRGRMVVVEYRPATQLTVAVTFSAEELHCLTCAMAGNFPAQFNPIRMDLLRKLARASRAAREE